MVASTHSRQPTVPHSILTTVLPSAAIPIAGAILINLFLESSRWENEPVHSLIEGMGSFAAIMLALFILIMRRSDELRPGYIWVATSLMGMGLLDGFHAGISPGNAFVWLHSVATFIGGVTFALIALPERLAKSPGLLIAPYIMAGSSITLGIGSILFPELIPSMVANKQFSISAELLNIIGGLGFIAAWFHFARQEPHASEQERVLLANHCMLFGVAGILFHFSSLWDITWWLWHVLRLFAYLVILWFFINIYNQQFKRTRVSEAALKSRSHELAMERGRLSDIIENSPSIITLKDTSGKFVIVNKRFAETFGVAYKDIIGKTEAEVFSNNLIKHSLEANNAGNELALSNASEESISIGAESKTFITSQFPLKNQNGKVYGVGGIQTDITERKAMEQRLFQAQQVIDHMKEAVVITDIQGNIEDINQAFTNITGYEREELIGKNTSINKSGRHDKEFYKDMWQKLLESGHWSGEIWDRKKCGAIYPKWLSISAIYDDNGKILRYAGIFNDISDQKETEKELKYLAFYDPLTKLPNRSLFSEHLKQALANCQRNAKKAAVMFIDLDRFKDVNDSLGHTVGDELLIQVAQRIHTRLRSNDTVSRLGGDEFTITLTDITNEESIASIGQEIIDGFQTPFTLFGNEIFVGCSIGIAVYPADGNNTEQLLKNADTAMYHAKELGRGRYQFFEEEMNETVLRRVSLERNLRNALNSEQFVLHYQTKHNLITKEVIGMEALIRWNHPEEGLISPAEFIPVAEQSDLIVSLGEWVLNTACKHAKEWQAKGLRFHRVAVNLSPKQFQMPYLLDLINATLKAHNLSPEYLELEITEGVVMDNPDEAINILHEIRDMGVHLSIDDFGTGYSSLAYLKKFPIDTLKIDQSFIRDLTIDSDDAAIVESVISMAKSLQVGVIAEGVETQEQVDFLKLRGCNEAQGYYLSKPIPHEQIMEKLSASRSGRLLQA